MFNRKKNERKYKYISNNVKMPALNEHEKLIGINKEVGNNKIYKKTSYKVASGILLGCMSLSMFIFMKPNQNQEDTAIIKKDNKVNIVAYADGSEEDSKMTLKEGVKIQAPWGQFTTEGFSGGGININGKNIDTLDIKTSNGELSYFDVNKLKERENENSGAYICKIPLEGDNINYNAFTNYDTFDFEKQQEKIQQEFDRLWDNGTLDDYKKYFDGDKVNLQDYSIGVRSNSDEHGKETVELTIADKKISEKWDNEIHKEGKALTLKYENTQDEDESGILVSGEASKVYFSKDTMRQGMNIAWTPDGKLLQEAQNGTLNYLNIEPIIIAIDTKYDDGSTQQDEITISIAKDASIIVEFK